MITERSLNLYKRAVNELPAYQVFLKARSFDPSSVNSLEKFSDIPVTTKKSYLQASKHTDLLWPQVQEGPLWYCSTSGSTGEPYYFPRVDEMAARGAEFAKAFLSYSSHGKGKTLIIMGFGMGVWIGGIITLRSFEIAAEKLNAPVSFLPTGYNKEQVFKALLKLSPEFEQTILIGYPPFIKEVVDEAKAEGIELPKLNIRLMFAAEAFTETFRNYVDEKAGITNPLLDTLNIYGSADLGAMAYETPLSILIRRLAIEDPFLYKEIFGQIEKTPTLAQYHPEFVEFENVNGELVLSSDGALPLMRYAIGDNGGVLTYEELNIVLRRYNVNLHAEIDKAGISHTVSKRPFVYVYERTDLAATLHGIIIYPEFVKEGVLHTKLAKFFSGKFTMDTKYDIQHNQFLQINLELKKDIELHVELERETLEVIRKTLIKKSSEFAEVSKNHSKQHLLQVVIWENGHPRYFSPGTKQSWVKKA